MYLNKLTAAIGALVLSVGLLSSAVPASAATLNSDNAVPSTSSVDGGGMVPQTKNPSEFPTGEPPEVTATAAPAVERNPGAVPNTRDTPVEPSEKGVTAEPLLEASAVQEEVSQDELTSEVPSLDWNPLLEPGSNARIGEEFSNLPSSHSPDAAPQSAETSAENYDAAFGPRTAKFEVTLVTVQLAGKTTADVKAINLEAARASIETSSNYWSAISNGRISMSIGREILAKPSAARITDSYQTIMATVTKELGWTYQPQKALVIFVPHADLNYGGSWGILGGGFTDGDLAGRVIMPYPSLVTNNVVSHEFGHVLGLHHANSLYCSTGRADVLPVGGLWNDSFCQTLEYADTLDLMGYAQVSTPVINSFMWEFGGFGRGDEIRNLGTASGSKQYTLGAWAGTAPNRAVKFTDPKTNETYYVELRLPVGRDASTAVGGNRGVKIVKKDILGWNDNASIQLTPDTRWTGYYNANQTWQAGSTFTTHGGTKVRVNSVSGTAASITITDPISALAPIFAAAASKTSGMGSATGPVT
ncbi:hypothetical protein ACX80P_16910, partial [Arthrobacter sp. TMS1-12-1]